MPRRRGPDRARDGTGARAWPHVSRAGRLFIAALWLTGLVSGLLVARLPGIEVVPTPHLVIPLAAGLLLELALRMSSRAGWVESLTVNERAIGVIGAALISMAVAALAAPAP